MSDTGKTRDERQKTGGQQRTKFGLVLEESAKEILAHVKGEKELPTRRVVLPEQSLHVKVPAFRQ